MSISVDELVVLLRQFRTRREIIKAMKVGIRKPVPEVRRKIRANAKATLPRRGGLAGWVAAARINVVVKLTGYKGVGIRLVGGRNSRGGRSDLQGIDDGTVRAPSWGRRTAASWHTQSVTPQFFTRPAAESDWPAAVAGEVDNALDQLRGL